MWPESNRVGFMAVRCRNILLARDIKICLGFSAGALKKRHQNLRIFSEIPTNLHTFTVTKH